MAIVMEHPTHARSLAAAKVDAGTLALSSRAALAEWLGTTSQVTRASRGMTIGGDTWWRLAGLYVVVSALLAMYDAAAIPGWLHGVNPHFGDLHPLDVLAAGDVASVIGAVQAARTGSFA